VSGLSEIRVSDSSETQVSGLSEIQVSDLSEISHYSPFQLEAACKRACAQGIRGYRQIKALIEEELATSQDRPANTHANLRGGQYYSQGR